MEAKEEEGRKEKKEEVAVGTLGASDRRQAEEDRLGPFQQHKTHVPD